MMPQMTEIFRYVRYVHVHIVWYKATLGLSERRPVWLFWSSGSTADVGTGTPLVSWCIRFVSLFWCSLSSTVPKKVYTYP